MRLSFVLATVLPMLAMALPAVTRAQENPNSEPHKINLEQLYDVEMSRYRNSLANIETAFVCGFVKNPQAAAALSAIESEMQRAQATDLPESRKEIVLAEIQSAISAGHDRATISVCNEMSNDHDHVVALQEMVEAVAQAQ